MKGFTRPLKVRFLINVHIKVMVNRLVLTIKNFGYIISLVCAK